MDSNRSRSASISEKIDHSEKSEKSVSKHSNAPEIQKNDEHTETNEHTEHNDESTEHLEQQNMYEKTLKSSESVEKKFRRNSQASNKPSRPSSPLVSRSMNFEQTSKSRSFKNLSQIFSKDPYLSSVNDMKYLGDQFIVGKINPNLKSPFEIRFEKRFQNTLKKLSASSNKMDTNKMLSEFRRTRNDKVILDPQFTLVNELKFTGDQFKVGKIDPKIQPPFEKRFQEKFKKQLGKLLPDQNRNYGVLKFEELKQMHNALALPRYIAAK